MNVESLTAVDVRELNRLLGDVRACRTAAEETRTLLDGLCRLIDADVAWFSENVKTPGGWRPIQTGAGSHVDGSLLRYVQQFGSEFSFNDDIIAASITAAPPAPAFAKHWRDISRQFATHEYGECRDLVRTIGVADMVNPTFMLRPNHLFSINIQRIGRRKELSPRELALMDYAAHELRWLAETGRLKMSLGNRPTGKVPNLSPRLRQVVNRLLEGTSPKQIAAELGISLWTVRDHAHRAYAHFGVKNRDELAAKFIR